MALKRKNKEEHPNILTNRSFCINKVGNYTIDPAPYNHHQYKDLIHKTEQNLRARNNKHLRTHIGKVKLHTEIVYNDSADTLLLASGNRGCGDSMY